MLKRRRGSILATAVSLTAIFLTLVVGATAYVENATRVTTSNRWRDMAEEAARSGLDFVFGWAEQNIDRVAKLPREWEALDDNQVLDPVAIYAAGATVHNDLSGTLANPSTILAGDLLGNVLNEYVLGSYGPYVVSFKARIQAYRMNEYMPRQYRVGVVGRVRKVKTPADRTADVDNDELKPIVAERMILANVGREPATRYAALIDIDSVRNWVPGEHVWGPVHINRGYVDDTQFRGVGRNLGSATATFNDRNETGGAVTIKATDLRSIMRLHVAGSSAGFVAPAGGESYPIFHEKVSVTAITTADGTYQNTDPGATNAIEVDNGSVAKYNSGMANAGKIFTHIENKGLKEWGGNPGPAISKKPFELPRSVRGALSVALGIPLGSSAYDYRGWLNMNLPDGLYMPTASWWDTQRQCSHTHAGWAAVTGAHGGASAFDYSGPPAGGIYIRGNVEVMRMGVDGNFSYYLFQLGYGDVPGQIASMSRRTYAVQVDRTNATPQVLIRAWPGGATGRHLHEITGAGTTRAQLFNLSGSGPLSVPSSPAASPSAWAMTGAGTIHHQFAAKNPGQFPFNGLVFVDLSSLDPARHPINPLLAKQGARPLTGNIFALGDPGETSDPQQDKRELNGRNAEYVATYTGTTRSNAASKLTIMSTGNIFIQNNIYLASLSSEVHAGAPNPRSVGTISVSPELEDTKDLLGIVADKQIVMGLHAPSIADPTNRNDIGVAVHAAIAALGDPGLDFGTGDPYGASGNGTAPWVPARDKTGTRSFRGSFTTEGVMQEFNSTPPIPEQYNVCVGRPYTLFYCPTDETGVANLLPFGTGRNAANWHWPERPPYYPAASNPTTATGYPGNPLYVMTNYQGAGTRFYGSPDRSRNPNVKVASRGKMMIFGAITQKKRGVIGVSNKSYDKDFRYDKRLQTLQPPLFPSSTNVLVRSVRPFSLGNHEVPSTYPYRAGGAAPNANANGPHGIRWQAYPLFFMSR